MSSSSYDVTNVEWFHAVNNHQSAAELYDRIYQCNGRSGEKVVFGVEMDIRCHQDGKEDVVAVLQHLPEDVVDLSLKELLWGGASAAAGTASATTSLNGRGLLAIAADALRRKPSRKDEEGSHLPELILKLDVKVPEAVAPSLSILDNFIHTYEIETLKDTSDEERCAWRRDFLRRVWFNADILPGGGEFSPMIPFAVDVLKRVEFEDNETEAENSQSSPPKSLLDTLAILAARGLTLSLGWSTPSRKENLGDGYSDPNVSEKMLKALRIIIDDTQKLKQNGDKTMLQFDVTFPVRHSCAMSNEASKEQLTKLITCTEQLLLLNANKSEETAPSSSSNTMDVAVFLTMWRARDETISVDDVKQVLEAFPRSTVDTA